MFEEYLIRILELSIEKNGEILLTNKHLLNIVKMAKDKKDYVNELNDKIFDSAGFPNG